MSAQFISINHFFFFFVREVGNHSSNKNRLENNFRKVWENYKNFRNFMIKNCFSQKYFLMNKIPFNFT